MMVRLHGTPLSHFTRKIRVLRVARTTAASSSTSKSPRPERSGGHGRDALRVTQQPANRQYCARVADMLYDGWP
jgi:hypothetical protein